MRSTLFILGLIALGVALQKGLIEIPRHWAPLRRWMWWGFSWRTWRTASALR